MALLPAANLLLRVTITIRAAEIRKLVRDLEMNKTVHMRQEFT